MEGYVQDQSLDLTGLKILIVDDDPDTQLLFTCLLESIGAVVAVVASACEAFTLLTQFTPDVLVSDIALPNEDGYIFIRKLRALEAKSNQFLPAIAVSAYIQGNDDLLAAAAGFQRWLSKPVDLDYLIRTIAEVVPHKTGDRCGSSRENKTEVWS
ncbi:response regulator [Phormidium sp. CLA17]|uniref:response regulator n=1 Tax=Leptolyngbya sp. Cla-17 TaxID=2803751 RepID=UPI00149195EF|nr:response regulator [Leptolyngbya sp. Cla-17]MBM0740266.1 response regulator [Leptolyngbya sp. Cla-17]MBM0745491.1 response regulator [Leptolyngbya sp. Cla-17]